MNRLSNEKGVTLVELLVVVAIMSMIIIATSTVQFQFLNTYQEIHDGSFQNDETSFFIQMFTNQVRNSSKIKISGDNKQIELTHDGVIVQFRYDSIAKTIAYTKGIQNRILLRNVNSFIPQRLIQNAKEGIQLDIQVQTGKQVVSLQVKAFSFIGTKG